jgi:hypothetical protein
MIRKSTVGRPKLPKGQKRAVVSLRLNESELALLRRVGSSLGGKLPLAIVVRTLIQREAARLGITEKE